MRRSTEPFFWLLFSSGGMLAALVLPALAFIVLLAAPLGWVALPPQAELLARLQPLWVRLPLLFLQRGQIVTLVQEAGKVPAHFFQLRLLPLRRRLIQEYRVELSLMLRIAQKIVLLLLLTNEEREVRAWVLGLHHHVEAVE